MMRLITVVGIASLQAMLAAHLFSAGRAPRKAEEKQPAGCVPLNTFSQGYLSWLRAAYGPEGVGDAELTLRRTRDGFPVIDSLKINRVTSDSLCIVAAGAFARRLGATDSTKYLPITVLTIDTLGYAVSPHYTVGPATLSITFDRSWTQIGGTVWRDTTPASLH